MRIMNLVSHGTAPLDCAAAWGFMRFSLRKQSQEWYSHQAARGQNALTKIW